ncbi:dihydrofolate reductase family protein [Chitinophaga sp. GbtcB8]|uniref:dihydrofolate reductase family protein n=1 Tax=Chitinophaga sp. GbtcB8 TaxID=2824753 RepID=UPI001C2F0F0D|nr:dihydrofolate reductase family protein [Chitinophaga sp. GbtcB8]
MRKLILQVQTSVDGYMAGKDGGASWMLWNWGNDWNWDAELQQYHTDLTASVDCILLSRKMATEGFIHHWAGMAKQTGNPQARFAGYITQAQKVVFTKTLQRSEWENTVLAKGDLAEKVNQLKQATGKNIIAYGGVTFAGSLLKAGLVDELHLVVNPVAIGDGLSVFSSLTGPLPFSLIVATGYKSSMVLLKYGKPS